MKSLAVLALALALACSAENPALPGAAGGAGTSAGAATQPSAGATNVGGGPAEIGGAAGTSGSASTGGATTAGSAGASPEVGGSAAGGAAGTGGSNATGGGGGAGGSSSAGTAGAPSFDPCPPKGTACAVMPMGDSITEGFRSSQYGGYRSGLFHLALAGGKTITFVGSAPLHGPAKVDGVTFPQQNEGVGGRRIADLQAIVPKTITTNHPHIVLLEIGTNDIFAGATSMASQLEKLIDGILAADSKLLLVVATVVPTTTDTKTATVEAYDALIPKLVQARAAQGKHIVLVDMFGRFTANASYKTAYFKSTDDLHPNDAGYDLMAQVWYDGIAQYLR